MARKVKDLFVYPIEREITPVIKIEDERNIAQELEEYVVTDKIEQNLIRFLEIFNETGLKESDKVGVWISGFFGCGKSHFAKILGYLLQNRQIGDKTASEIFNGRIKGSDRENEIRALLHEMNTKINSHVIMFQIMSEEDQLEEKKSIRKTIYQQFLKYRGLSEDIHIAELEQELILEERYEEFKEEIKRIEGKDWEEVRKSKLFAKKPIGLALSKLYPDEFESEEVSIKAFEYMEKEIKVSISSLTDKIVRYTDNLEKEGEVSPHVVFIVDEVGQYIGVSDDLLLELQSLVEQFGVKGRGKIWLIVTAQERLDEIIEGVGGKKTNYTKIMDRFDTKLHLTSDNIVKVLEERILKKKEQTISEISGIYSNYTGTISFVSNIEGANRPIVECNENNFVSSYPFLPHQLQITQNIFTSIRHEAGHLRKITGTERSMLGITQAILKSSATGFKDSDIGRLVSFDEIFDQIVTEIPPDILKDIERVEIKLPGDPGIVKKTLKSLYLLQQIDWVPNTIENLTKAVINNVDVRVADYQSLVNTALDELVKGRYLICENNQYEYISGTKKLIEDEISREPIKAYEEKRYAKETLRNIIDMNKLNRVEFEGMKYFSIKVFGDDEEFHTKGEIELKIYSPVYYKYKNVDKESVIDDSYKNTNTIYWLPNPDIDISAPLSKYLRTLKVIERRDKSTKKSPEEVELLREKKAILEAMKGSLEKSIKRALLSGIIIYDGNAEELNGKSENLKSVCEREISNLIPSIYTRFEDAKFKVSEKSIQQILTTNTSDLHLIEKDLNLFDEKGNINLHTKLISEINSTITSACDKGEDLTGSKLMDFFEKIPYGWDMILMRIIITALFRSGSIYLKYDGSEFADYQNSDARDLLIKSNKFKKTFLLYEKEEVVPLPERRRIQRYLDVIFNIKSDDTINALSKHVENSLLDMKLEYEKQKIYWDQNGYTLKDVFYKIEELCENISSQKRSSKKLKAFLNIVDDIKTAYEYQNEIQKFMESDDSKILPRLKNLPGSLTVSSIQIDEKIKSNFETYKKEIETIVLNKELIDKWQTVLMNYTKAISEFKKVYEALHRKRYEIYHKMQEEITADPYYSPHIKSDTFDIIKTYLCKENYQWSIENLRCIGCNYNLSELDSHILAEDKKREMIIAKIVPSGKPGQPKRVQINLRVASGKTIIKNDADMEEALVNIRKKIKGHLDKDETVLLQ